MGLDLQHGVPLVVAGEDDDLCCSFLSGGPLRRSLDVDEPCQEVALGQVYQAYRLQATVLAYSDVFYYSAIVAFLMVPFCFMLSPKIGGGGPGGAH